MREKSLKVFKTEKQTNSEFNSCKRNFNTQLIDCVVFIKDKYFGLTRQQTMLSLSRLGKVKQREEQ
jgi:hypothetical protein